MRQLLHQVTTACQEHWENCKQLLKDTSVEVVLFAVLGGGIAGGVSGFNEYKRAQTIPLSFSERDHLKRELAHRGETLSPSMEYTLQTSDLCMKVFECHNKAVSSQISNQTTHRFAEELDRYMSLRYLHSEEYNLAQLITNHPELGTQMRSSLQEYLQLIPRFQSLDNNLSKVRKDKHSDIYKRVMVTKSRTVTDSKGNTSTEYYTELEQQYDYTIHQYHYFPQQGKQIHQQLTELFQLTAPSLRDKIYLTNLTNAEGEYAALVSRRKHLSDVLSQDELTYIANLAVTGSSILTSLKLIDSTYQALSQSAQQWSQEYTIARSHNYRTSSQRDSGPKEYQTIQQGDHQNSLIYQHLTDIDKLLTKSERDIALMHTKINQLIAIKNDPTLSPVARQLKKEILSLAKDVYSKNFSQGVDLNTFRTGRVALFIFLGILLGASLGVGIDKLAQEYDRYKEDSIS